MKKEWLVLAVAPILLCFLLGEQQVRAEAQQGGALRNERIGKW